MLAPVMEGRTGAGGTGLRRDAEFCLGMQLEVHLGYWVAEGINGPGGGGAFLRSAFMGHNQSLGSGRDLPEGCMEGRSSSLGQTMGVSLSMALSCPQTAPPITCPSTRAMQVLTTTCPGPWLPISGQ